VELLLTGSTAVRLVVVVLAYSFLWLHNLPADLGILHPTLMYLEERKFTLVVEETKMWAWEA